MIPERLIPLMIALALSSSPGLNGANAPAGYIDVPLWQGVPPGTPDGALPPEKNVDDAHTAHVAAPSLWLSLPDKKQGGQPVPLVLLMPGGGYGIVGHKYEGTEIAAYLKSRGIASAVLLYRCSPQQFPAPLLDARRALAILHDRAAEWNVDPGKIGVMGFSAGGHLAGLATSTLPAGPASPASVRPAFSILVYPVVRLRGPLSHGGSGVNLLGKERMALANEADHLAIDNLVDDHWPRTYLLHEKDDPAVPPAGTLALATAMEKLKVPHQIHLEPGNDHGFGWNRPDAAGKIRGPAGWLPRVADWILE